MIDLSLVSDEELSREYWRRAHAARQGGKGGRPKKLKPCPKCGEQFGFNELREHKPKCTHPQKFFIPKPKATREKIGADGRVYVTREGIRLGWSNPLPLPMIGDHIDITMNSIGRARVEGYFMEGGYVGVMTKALYPPKWLVQQRKEVPADAPQWIRDGIGCEFGREISIRKPRRARRQK